MTTSSAAQSPMAFKSRHRRSRIRNQFIATVTLGTFIAIILLEVAHCFETDAAGPWQLVLRFVLTSAMSVAIAIGLSLYVSRRWVRQVASIQAALVSRASGDPAARADVFSHDELGAIALAVNNCHDAAPGKSLTIQDRCSFQGSLAELVDASLQVSTSANQLGASTEKLSKESEFHTAQINDTSAAVDEIVESIRQVAENTFISAKVAAEARHTATVGSQAVSNTIKGMQRIRNQVQSTSKRIKQLGESTQQIGEIVQLISEVADRTSILALNASIQAAMAGEAGQGFGVVAEEVEHLAKRCNEATKQMAKLVKGVQAETSEAIAGMEESIAEVVEGSKLASQAGEALADIDSVSHRQAELINSISAAAKQQVRGGLLASRSMNEISAVMHENAVATKQAAQAVSQLAALADQLRSAIERFQAPNAIPPAPDEPGDSETPLADGKAHEATPFPWSESGSGWPAAVTTESLTI